MVEAVPQRIVPGAPPPPPLTKSQIKKKRKAKAKANESTQDSPVATPDPATVIEKKGENIVVQNGTVAQEATAQEEVPAAVAEPEVPLRTSPIVELINKRLKATNKKIVRFRVIRVLEGSTHRDITVTDIIIRYNGLRKAER